MDRLAAVVSSALRDNDPLEPWLTESHWDEHYWDDEATEIALRLRPGMSRSQVRATIVDVLTAALPEVMDGDGTGTRRDRQLDVVAKKVQSVVDRP